MKKLGVLEEQPTGCCCKDCAETIRRGFPQELRAAILDKIATQPSFKEEFDDAREKYIEDMRDKIRFGNNRIKKRARSVTKTEQVQCSNRMKGVMVVLENYRKAISEKSRTTRNQMFVELPMGFAVGHGESSAQDWRKFTLPHLTPSPI